MEEKTYFAPAERSTIESIMKESELVASQKFFLELFRSMTGIAAIINSNRQIVYANDEFLSGFGFTSLEQILGKRPGEVVSCFNSTTEPSGCGTSRACAYCGAVNAIIESQNTGLKSSKDANISVLSNGKIRNLNLSITSAPVTLEGDVFYILIVQDISGEKKRVSLERVFFHDLLNSLGGLNGILNVLKLETDVDEIRRLIDVSEEYSRNIIDEILMQRHIREAETGELKLKVEMVNSIEFIDSVISKISFHEVAKSRMIIKSEKSDDVNFETDKTIFQRIIINLLKNALEASPENGSVTVSVEEKSDKVIFSVKNDQVIPEDIQRQIFQRSFSTKGAGRGLGTYSIRLFTENYLAGKVSFISNNVEKTIFSIELNKVFPSGRNY